MPLKYAFSTSPAPLQVSSPWSPTSGRINIAVLNPDRLYCDQVAVQLWVGPDAPAFGRPRLPLRSAPRGGRSPIWTCLQAISRPGIRSNASARATS